MMSNLNAAETKLVENVNSRLREEWGITIHSIPTDRLRWSLDNDGDAICVKIPSRSEFDMSVDEAKAVLKALVRR